MKKFLFFLVSTSIFISALAQESTTSAAPKNAVKINTLSLIVGTGSLFYERSFSPNLSGQLGLGFMSYEFFEETKFSGLFLTPEIRYYPKSDALDGLYFAPFLRWQHFSVKSLGAYGDYNNVGGGLLIGRQWIFKRDFTLDLFFGGHYGAGSFSGTGTPETDIFEGFRPRFGLAIGFAF